MLAKKDRLNLKLRANQQIFTLGKTVASRYFVLYYLNSSHLNISQQISVVISKKVSNQAVLRNHLKRQLYEIFHDLWFKNKKIDPAIKQLALIVKPAALRLNYQQLIEQILYLLKKIDIF